MIKKFLPIFIFTFLTLPFTVLAEEVVVKKGVLDDLGCLQTGNCGLTDVEVGFQLLTNWLIGGIGALGLMFFIWGAIEWITSYGSSEKIKHGRDIMMGSVAAIIVAFTSYLLIQFFINNLLLGGGESEQFQISAECVDKPQETTCNQPQINYVCSGGDFDGDMAIYNNLCITRCDLKAITTGDGWVCLNNGSYDNYVLEESVVDNGCPVKFQTCVLPIGRITPPDISNPDVEMGVGTPDTSGCCLYGTGSCEDVNNEINCIDGSFYSGSCSRVNQCQSGFVELQFGCCVESGGDFDNPHIVGCQDVEYGDVCEHTFVFSRCNSLDYCFGL